MDQDMQKFMARCRTRVDQALDSLLPPPGDDGFGRLAAAMRHAVLGGGKRLRPVTVIAACEAVGGTAERALPGACAVELVHAYSLVHDDLPAMDDDVERRGRPTVHVAFDEATAILAGDALLTLAFESLAAPAPGSGDRRLAAVYDLARLCGHAGLVGGQSLDMAYAGAEVESLDELERIHLGKTAALFRVSAAIGGHLGDADPAAQQTLNRWGEELGLAFQHADDRLDDEHRHLAAATAHRLTELLDGARARAQSFGAAGRPLVGLVELVEAYAG
ncbi:MAG: polyprenyl synthetase family protein [bacterium]